MGLLLIGRLTAIIGRSVGRFARALRCAWIGPVAQTEPCGPIPVGGVFAIDFLDVVAGGLHRLATRQKPGLDGKKLRLDILQRIDPVPPRRDPLHGQGGVELVQCLICGLSRSWHGVHGAVLPLSLVILIMTMIIGKDRDPHLETL